jgi:hypothetical protein
MSLLSGLRAGKASIARSRRAARLSSAHAAIRRGALLQVAAERAARAYGLKGETIWLCNRPPG